MTGAAYRFDRFLLLADDRRLLRGEEPVEISARYLDALTLLVREPERLVTKDRFMDEVWRGVPVTDEALTQCIRTLRRSLGDEAGRPRFIETVPKHGYRFIAPVEVVDSQSPPSAAKPVGGASDAFLRTAVAGTLGGGLAGVIGGLVIGFAAGMQPGTGAASAVLVLLCVTLLVALLGGAGVATGIAAARTFAPGGGAWPIGGGAIGGLVVGAMVKLLGTDAFTLLVGRSPGDITGAAEGMLLGGAAGLAAWLGRRNVRRGMTLAALAGGAAGVVATLLGGRLLIGSLDQLARQFPESRLRMDGVGALLGEQGIGPVSLAITAALEGGLFCACLVGAMALAERKRANEKARPDRSERA